MEFFCFCLEIIKREAARFNVSVNTSTASQLTAANANDVNYDNAHNRCAFLYRCGTINLSLTRDCFSKFLSEYNGIQYLLSKWRFDTNLKFCSISKGPALDYIALLLSHEQCKIFTSLIRSIRIIAKHGAWRNSANIMLDIINNGYFKELPPSFGNVEVIQGDPLNNFTEKIRFPVQDSDIVMMIKALNLQSDGYDQTKISKNIQEFLEILKPSAVLFCIDTKPSIKEITQLLTMFPGKYLLKPISMNTLINLEYAQSYKAQLGCLPIVSGRGCFFVWEKYSVSASSVNYELNELTESVKYFVNTTDKKSDKVDSDGCRFESSCKTQLSKESKTCDPELSEHFNNSNMSKIDEKSNAVNTSDIGSSDPLLADNNCFKKSSYFSPSNSSINQSVSISNNLKDEGFTISALKSQLDSISKSRCKQTEPEEIKITKITELTNKITELTVELTKLLANNTLKNCVDDNCSRNSEEMDKSLDAEIISSMIGLQNFTACCCQKCVCHQCGSFSNHDKSNALEYDEVTNYCKPSSSTKSIFLAENTSSAQLVIPLNNLSANIVSQIISLIMQSNHETVIK